MHQNIQLIRVKVCRLKNLRPHRRPQSHHLWAFLTESPWNKFLLCLVVENEKLLCTFKYVNNTWLRYLLLIYAIVRLQILHILFDWETCTSTLNSIRNPIKLHIDSRNNWNEIFRQNAEWRSAFCYDLRPSWFVVRWSSITKSATRIYQQQFDHDSPNFTPGIRTGPVSSFTRYDVTSWFRSEVIAKKLSKMPPPVATGRISREWLDRKNFFIVIRYNQPDKFVWYDITSWFRSAAKLISILHQRA